MFDPTKIIRAMWVLDSESGDEVLIDLDHNTVLLRRKDDHIVEPNEKVGE